MDNTLVLRGADGRSLPHDKPIGFFFTGDPQTDTLLPASLLNGFALEGQPSRVDPDMLYPFLDMTIKALAALESDGVMTVGERLTGVVKASLAGEGLEQAAAEHDGEVAAFARNRVEYPYILLRDFEEPPASCSSPPSASARRGLRQSVVDEAPRTMHHSNGLGRICAYRLSTMASLEQIVLEWSQGLLVAKLAQEVAPRHLPDFLVLQLGKWRTDGVGGGIVVVLLQLALDRVTLIDRYTSEDHASTLTLLHLGPSTVPVNKEDFFDDMLELDEFIATHRILGAPVIERIRFWQSHVDSHTKGAVIALQAMYIDSADPSTHVRTPIRGSKHGAHYFVDIALSQGEFIYEISCFYVAGVYGSITLHTNVGSYTVGSRETGTHHKIQILRQDLFDLVAFAGETSRDGPLTCLKVITVQPHHFGTLCGPKPPPSLQPAIHVEVSTTSNRKHVAPSRTPADGHSLSKDTNSSIFDQPRPRSALSEDFGTSERPRSVFQQKSESSGLSFCILPLESLELDADNALERCHNMCRTAQVQPRVRPSSALPSHSTNNRDDGRAVMQRRPQSATTRQSGGKGAVSAPIKSAGGQTQFEKNLEMSIKHVHENDLPGGRRLRVKADDAEADALLKASGDEDTSSADWKQGIRDAISQGIITAQTRLLLQVEYCTATRPSSTLRGSKEQYSRVVTDLKEKITSLLWEYNTTVLDNRFRLHVKFEFWAENEDCVTTPIAKPRIGSCEIVLSWQHRSTPRTIVIHSKLHSRKWPVVDTIVEELLHVLPAQYHDIRFFAQSSTQNSCPKGAKVTVFMKKGSDPLGLIGKKATAIADADGVAHISLPLGLYEIKVEHENFHPTVFHYRIGEDEYEPFRRIVLHPRCEKDEVKISLVWNESPSDLDLYAVTAYTKVCHSHLSDDRISLQLGEDARKGYGPEMMSFKRLSKEAHTDLLREGRSCMINIFVHNYSGECDLTESGAILTIMNENGVLNQLEVPKVGLGEFWDACSIDMRHLFCIDRNKIVPSEPVFDILVSGDADGVNNVYIQSTCPEFGEASESSKMDLAQSPKGGSSMARSVALLHDYHNYNGIR